MNFNVLYLYCLYSGSGSGSGSSTGMRYTLSSFLSLKPNSAPSEKAGPEQPMVGPLAVGNLSLCR